MYKDISSPSRPARAAITPEARTRTEDDQTSSEAAETRTTARADPTKNPKPLPSRREARTADDLRSPAGHATTHRKPAHDRGQGKHTAPPRAARKTHLKRRAATARRGSRPKNLPRRATAGRRQTCHKISPKKRQPNTLPEAPERPRSHGKRRRHTGTPTAAEARRGHAEHRRSNPKNLPRRTISDAPQTCRQKRENARRAAAAPAAR